jgi:nanoRNase/pAp phosphatase (c-di-AMP/oligoRNAs hydrolase)
MTQQKYRLVTRSDFDGLACAVLLNELEMIDDILFVHPKDMQDGKIAIGPGDITTNLPYVPGAHLAFDHHSSENLRNAGKDPNYVIHENAPSAARVVYESYGGSKRFPARLDDMMYAVDKGDSADFTLDEILDPKDWVLLNYLMDSRTGLGRFRNFRVSNYQLMMDLINYVANHTIEEVLALPDVEERVDLYFYHAERAKKQILRCTKVHGNLAVLDLREEETIYATNRFMIYALFPQVNISIHVMWGVQKQNTVLATGKSILDRSSRTNIGELMLSYGGGGHEAAGTCQVANDQADETIKTLITAINADG